MQTTRAPFLAVRMPRARSTSKKNAYLTGYITLVVVISAYGPVSWPAAAKLIFGAALAPLAAAFVVTWLRGVKSGRERPE